MSQITPEGFQADDLATIYAWLVERMQAIFGPDLDLDPDTIDGETLGIYAEAKVDSDQLAQQVYNSWNPQTATGVSLSRIVQYNGIRRLQGTKSAVQIQCVGVAGTYIPLNSIVRCTANSEQFYTIQEGLIDATGMVTVSALSMNVGAIQAPAGTLTEILTPVYNWQSATNPADATIGRETETDEELRLRRAASTATPAQSLPDAIYGGVANVAGVTQARVYENYDDVADAVTGLPPHSFSVIVQGGDDYDIAYQIWVRASIGATQVGDTSVDVSDVQGYTHTITFQRPITVPIFMTITIQPLSGWTDTVLPSLIENLVVWSQANWHIGDTVYYSRIYEPINDMPKVFSIETLLIGTDAVTQAAADIAIDYKEMGTLISANIVVNLLPQQTARRRS